jgi:hypothetical protein
VRRRLLNVFTALSLLLCVAALALWVRSFWAFDRFDHQHRDAQGRLAGVNVSSYRGVLVVQTTRLDQTIPGSERWVYAANFSVRPTSPGQSAYDPSVTRVMAGFGSGGFRYAIRTAPPPGGLLVGGTARTWVVPCYALAVVAAILPLARVWRAWKRSREYRPGQCLPCGYDLRATPGRCPECGTAVPTRAQG